MRISATEEDLVDQDSLDALTDLDWENIIQTAKEQQDAWYSGAKRPSEDDFPEDIITTSIGYVTVGLFGYNRGFVSAYGDFTEFAI